MCGSPSQVLVLLLSDVAPGLAFAIILTDKYKLIGCGSCWLLLKVAVATLVVTEWHVLLQEIITSLLLVVSLLHQDKPRKIVNIHFITNRVC